MLSPVHIKTTGSDKFRLLSRCLNWLFQLFIFNRHGNIWINWVLSVKDKNGFHVEGEKQIKCFSCCHTFLQHKALIRKRLLFPSKRRKTSSKFPKEELLLIDPICCLRHRGVALTYRTNSLSGGHPTQTPNHTHFDRCGLIKNYLMLTLLGRRSATVFFFPPELSFFKDICGWNTVSTHQLHQDYHVRWLSRHTNMLSYSSLCGEKIK